MENIKIGYISVGQVIRMDNKVLKFKKIIKKYKLGLIIGGISISLLSIYAVLIVNFINLIRIMY